MRRLWITTVVLGVVALPVAVLRYFTKGWLEPAGIPTVVGSFAASLTVVLLVGLVVLFGGEARAPAGSYWRALSAYAALAAWCELLVILGILIAERSGAVTYYSGPWEAVHRAFPSPGQHAIGHAQGFFIRMAIGSVLGGVIYAWQRRSRRTRG